MPDCVQMCCIIFAKCAVPARGSACHFAVPLGSRTRDKGALVKTQLYKSVVMNLHMVRTSARFLSVLMLPRILFVCFKIRSNESARWG